MEEWESHASKDVLLDVSKVPGDHVSLDSIEQLYEALAHGGGKRYTAIRVQYNGLATLSLTSPLTMAVHHVTSLIASYNRISTLQGIDAFVCLEFLDLSHNSLRVLDAHSTSLLRRLGRLQRCDFSFNELRMVDFDSVTQGSGSYNDMLSQRENVPSSALASGTGLLEELKVLNLSQNQLIEVPDLRCMPMLEELDLEYNRIDSMIDLENRLPLVALTSLSIGNNNLGQLQSLLPLTVLAETLTVLTVKGNPCVLEGAAGCTEDAIRSWLLWLLPRLTVLDRAPLTSSERHTAARLFRRNNMLDCEAIGMMNSHQNAQLVAYLKKFSNPRDPHPQVDYAVANHEQVPSTNCSIVTHNNVHNSLISVQQSPVTARQMPALAFNKEIRGPPTRQPPSLEFVLQMLQKKVKQLSNVMEVLWKESMSRRVFAAIVLQKHFRGFLARRCLPASVRTALRRVVARVRNPPGRIHAGHATSHPTAAHPFSRNDSNRHSVVGASGSGSSSKNAPGESNADLARRIHIFDSVVRQLERDMHDFRKFEKRRRELAALTIQKHYRGYIGRKNWRILKENYDEFVYSLQRDVLEMQRVCRGYRSRVRLGKRYQHQNELRLLRVEIAELRGVVFEMRAELQRCQQKLAADPEAAVSGIVVRHSKSLDNVIGVPNSSIVHINPSKTSASAAATAAAALASASSRLAPPPEP
ncbi:Leucine rich repeat IQ calmodulin binding motif [Trypanosoma vivax]|nr:putative leucine-rich repeat protein [Trypanosoma vivax]KAH8609022.1 Leucine rich repeat IQ calmodulin binding motif [Trypanosoma vivax]